MNRLDDRIYKVTQRIIERSRPGRSAYLDLMQRERERAPEHKDVACSNLAHAFAGALALFHKKCCGRAGGVQ